MTKPKGKTPRKKAIKEPTDEELETLLAAVMIRMISRRTDGWEKIVSIFEQVSESFAAADRPSLRLIKGEKK